MKKLLIAVTLLLTFAVADSAYAGIDTSGLSKDQIDAIQKTVDSVKNKTSPSVKALKETATFLTKHKGVGEQVADEIVGFTSKIGTSSADFVKSPTGTAITVFGIIYFFGKTAFGIILGLLWFFIAGVTLWKIYSKKAFDVEIEEKPTDKKTFLGKVVMETRTSRTDRSSDELNCTFIIATILYVFIGLLLTF